MKGLFSTLAALASSTPAGAKFQNEMPENRYDCSRKFLSFLLILRYQICLLVV